MNPFEILSRAANGLGAPSGASIAKQKIFPTRHPSVKKKDGSESNVVIMGYSESDDGPIYAIPTMVDGKQLSEKEAIKIALSHGLDKYPKHKTGKEHNEWAKKYHGSIDKDGYLKPDPIERSIMRAIKQNR